MHSQGVFVYIFWGAYICVYTPDASDFQMSRLMLYVCVFFCKFKMQSKNKGGDNSQIVVLLESPGLFTNWNNFTMNNGYLVVH